MVTLPGRFTAPLDLADLVSPFVATSAANASPSVVSAIWAFTARRELASSTVVPIL